jgi:hypothetical protein
MNACAASSNLNVEIAMLPRLAAALANWGRAIASLRHHLFPRKREREQPVVELHCLVRPTDRIGDRSFSPTRKRESSEFIRTQNQLMETMIKSMILASGGNVDGTGGSEVRSQRSAGSVTKL